VTFTEARESRPLHALLQRLGVAAEVLLGERARDERPLDDAGAMLEAMAAALQPRADASRVWLLLAALTAGFPRPDEVRSAIRHLEHQAPRDAAVWLLRFAGMRMTIADAVAEIALVTEGIIVDVDFSSKNDLNTGIQRVVRQLVPRWSRAHDLTLIRWRDGKMFVGLTAREAQRVLGEAPAAYAATDTRLVPWGVPVILPEVPFPGHGDRLAGLAQFSPNTVRAIGYDCIPMVSADLVGETEREKFGEYLELVKHADVVAGISRTAAAEFEGFVAALGAQGLTGPEIVTCALPTTERVPAPSTTGREVTVPEVLCVGSPDRRKNQIALVEAAEHLWREGLDFRLRLIGAGGNRPKELTDLVDDLITLGRPIDVREGVADREIDEAYRAARVFVFPTRHEGFGLPVVEALSYGVPVITSDFGSTREISEGNGALLVDPEDVPQLVDALRRLLTDDDLHAELVTRAHNRPSRTWDDYAAELWEVFSR
jgi:glycosyltransferase involved in cell wall biosynthesis